jgi:putative ABC transport system permease protein
MFALFLTAALVSLLYAPVTIGLAIAFRTLNFPDLTCEGSFMFGGAISLFALDAGCPASLSICCGLLGGFIAGALTAVLHTHLKVSRLLSGIITSAILYSATIHLLSGQANRRVTRATIFDAPRFDSLDLTNLVVASLVTGLVLTFCWALYRSRLGRILRAIGDQQRFCVSLGRNPKAYLIVGLGVANALIGLAGATLVHFKRVCDVNMGFGVLVAALAGLVLGETVYSARSVWTHSAMCLVGTAIYNVALGAFYFDWGIGIEKFILPSDVRLVTGLLLILPAVILLRVRRRYRLFNSSW